MRRLEDAMLALGLVLLATFCLVCLGAMLGR